MTFATFIIAFGISAYYNTLITGKILDVMSLIYSTAGLLFIYGLCNRIIDNIKAIPAIITTTAKYSFAIYVYHQFILYFLYYNTTLPALCGKYALPWCALIITALTAYVLSHYTLKTKTGKWLLG